MSWRTRCEGWSGKSCIDRPAEPRLHSRHVTRPLRTPVPTPCRAVPEFSLSLTLVPPGKAPDRDLLEKTFSRRALRLLFEWMELHREELERNWVRAREREPLQPIQTLT
jgi:hypothetical protein